MKYRKESLVVIFGKDTFTIGELIFSSDAQMIVVDKKVEGKMTFVEIVDFSKVSDRMKKLIYL